MIVVKIKRRSGPQTLLLVPWRNKKKRSYFIILHPTRKKKSILSLLKLTSASFHFFLQWIEFLISWWYRLIACTVPGWYTACTYRTAPPRKFGTRSAPTSNDKRSNRWCLSSNRWALSDLSGTSPAERVFSDYRVRIRPWPCSCRFSCPPEIWENRWSWIRSATTY